MVTLMSRKITGSAHHFTKVCSFKEMLQVVQSIDSFTTFFGFKLLNFPFPFKLYIPFQIHLKSENDVHAL